MCMRAVCLRATRGSRSWNQFRLVWTWCDHWAAAYKRGSLHTSTFQSVIGRRGDHIVAPRSSSTDSASPIDTPTHQSPVHTLHHRAVVTCPSVKGVTTANPRNSEADRRAGHIRPPWSSSVDSASPHSTPFSSIASTSSSLGKILGYFHILLVCCISFPESACLSFKKAWTFKSFSASSFFKVDYVMEAWLLVIFPWVCERL